MSLKIVTRSQACLAALSLAGLLLLANASEAQTTYRWQDPKNGQTVISDRPPPAGVQKVVTQTENSRRNTEDSAATVDPRLPYATQQASKKYPVTLYSASNCLEACRQARDLLGKRGVPFKEHVLQNEEEISQLSEQLGTSVVVPSLSVGTQYFKGLEANGWQQLLDLAGYPKAKAYGNSRAD